MGIQNAAATRFSGATLNTVFLTGDLQKLTQAVVSRVVGTRPSQSDAGAGVLALVYASYFIGVLLGAAAQLWVGRPLLLAALLLPVSLLPFRRTTDTAAGTRDSG
jgi:uncharacterized membrane protein YoaK (UPF0700 family)